MLNKNNTSYLIANEILGNSVLAYNISQVTRNNIVHHQSFTRHCWHKQTTEICNIIQSLDISDYSKISLTNDPENDFRIKISVV